MRERDRHSGLLHVVAIPQFIRSGPLLSRHLSPISGLARPFWWRVNWGRSTISAGINGRLRAAGPFEFWGSFGVMTHDSDIPQRIPKRPIQEGRAVPAQHSQPPAAAQPAPNIDSANIPNSGEPLLPTDSAGQKLAQPAAERVAQAKPRTKATGKVAPVTTAPKLQTADRKTDESIWGRFRAWMKTAPALSFSLLLHLVAFLILGAATFVAWEPEKELLITASSVDVSEAPIEELTEIDMGELEDFEEETFEEEVAEMSEIVLDDVSIDAPIADAIPEVVGTAPPVGTSANKGKESATKPKKKSSKKGGKSKASFYGAPAQGNRFAFIVDNSNSMVNGKMLTTIDQLLRTVRGLTKEQEFYVIFYSDTAYPMFYPNSESAWVTANKENKQRLYDWLQTIELCSGGHLEEALALAFQLEPDSIFLVGDGTDVGKAEQDVVVAQTKKRRYAVHTLCIGGNGEGAKKLAGLAEYTGGTFRFVQPIPALVEMSKTTKFKMNRSRGKVWGKKIGR